MRTQTTLDAKTFNDFLNKDEWIYKIANPVGCKDKNGNHKHYHTCSYPVEYIVSDEQIAKAKERQQQRKQQIIEDMKPGELTFVSMGMNYVSDTPDSVCNHRIRCNLTNLKGETYLIEFCKSTNRDSFWVDTCENQSLKESYNKECQGISKHNHGIIDRSKQLPYPSQYYRMTDIERKNTIPGTWKAIVEFVNKNLDCNYSSARKQDYFIRAEDFINRCVSNNH